ncbi:FitA-like ribbon-helix-helix domain-containing protein [Aeromicrobium sp. 9AM]|uniref:FitA-like ribbon-helix-helix domain-containing protein n=1 Tax=Aeromicrobium sp. 9AM TaxID=2653126 RepID=UPI0012F392E1|nr:plasmid stability protein [Aeromicrobium sp. 9AM]VXB34504.1 putative plasmid stability protein y4jJ [Aeromicrobium sp. 9AM]
MAAVTIRNLSDETHRALKAQAARNGRSTEAEIREILGEAVKPRVGLGDVLAEVGARVGGVELDVVRDTTEPEAPDLR